MSLRLDSLLLAGARRFLSVRIAMSAHAILLGPFTRAADSYGNAYTWTNFFSAAAVAAHKQQITADCAQMESINAVVWSAERKYLLRYSFGRVSHSQHRPEQPL